MELEKISVQQLFSLNPERFDDYNSVLKNLLPKSTFNGVQANDIYELSFSDVSWLKEFIQETTFENFVKAYNMVFGIPEEAFLKCDVLDFYQSFNWIQQEILELVEGEKNLSSEIEPELKEAGIDELNIFGDMNTLIGIGKDFGKSPKEVEQWSYSLVFALSYHSKITSDVNKRYTKILNKPK